MMSSKSTDCSLGMIAHSASSHNDSFDTGMACVCVPGDKSIAHRIFMLACMRSGVTRITNVPNGLDVVSTVRVLRQLGADIEQLSSSEYLVKGWGERGPLQPTEPLDCGNSGTTARLILGVIAPWDIEAVVTGDPFLRARPMKRVVEPLSSMGAAFDGDVLPITIRGTTSLQAGCFDLTVSSAQVKSALLLAGLRAKGGQFVSEPFLSRSHTEIMLHSDLLESTETIVYSIPGDPSSAAFLLVASLLKMRYPIRVKGVCLNPTRLGFVRVLQRMGVDVSVEQSGECHGEPVGDLTLNTLCKERRLLSVDVQTHEIAQLIDEIPVLALAAAFAEGESVFRGVEELKVKESNRLEGIVDGLSELGICATVQCEQRSTDLVIKGRPELLGRHGLLLPEGASLDARKDHRLALTWLVACECSVANAIVKGAECIDVSYPSFGEDLKGILK